MKGSKKRVVYPWLKKSMSRTCKCYLAVVTDSLDWSDVFNGKMPRKKFFREEILPKVEKSFPAIFGAIRKHYRKNGRVIEHKEFVDILYGRFANMYAFDTDNKRLMRTGEHPEEAKDYKVTASYLEAKKIFEKNTSYKKKV